MVGREDLALEGGGRGGEGGVEGEEGLLLLLPMSVIFLLANEEMTKAGRKQIVMSVCGGGSERTDGQKSGVAPARQRTYTTLQQPATKVSGFLFFYFFPSSILFLLSLMPSDG